MNRRAIKTNLDALSLAMNDVVMASKELQKQTREMQRAQAKLRAAVDGEAWSLYLRLEQIMTKRLSSEVELLVKWALTVGAKTKERGSSRAP